MANGACWRFLMPERGATTGLDYDEVSREIAAEFIEEFLGAPYPGEIPRVAHFVEAVRKYEREVIRTAVTAKPKKAAS